MTRCTISLRLTAVALTALALMRPVRAAADDNTVTITNKGSHVLYVAEGWEKDDSVDTFVDTNAYHGSRGWKKLAPGDTYSKSNPQILLLVAAVNNGKVSPVAIEYVTNGKYARVMAERGAWYGVVTDKFEQTFSDYTPDGIRQAGYTPFQFARVPPGDYLVGVNHESSVVDPLKKP